MSLRAASIIACTTSRVVGPPFGLSLTNTRCSSMLPPSPSPHSHFVASLAAISKRLMSASMCLSKSSTVLIRLDVERASSTSPDRDCVTCSASGLAAAAFVI